MRWLARLGVLFVGVGPLAAIPVVVSASSVVTAVPGNTVVQDAQGDFNLRNCDPDNPSAPCSRPPDSSGVPAPYLDIKTAKITQVADDVELSIAFYAPVPATPTQEFISYFWQFEGGCIGTGRGVTDKDGIHVKWERDGAGWSANFFKITSCIPRVVEQGDAVDFRFTEDSVRVRVPLSELITEVGASIAWHAGVRRLRFSSERFPNSIALDVAPDVIAFDPDSGAVIRPESPAHWEER